MAVLDLVFRHPVVTTLVAAIACTVLTLGYAGWYIRTHSADSHDLDFPRT